MNLDYSLLELALRDLGPDDAERLGSTLVRHANAMTDVHDGRAAVWWALGHLCLDVGAVRRRELGDAMTDLEGGSTSGAIVVDAVDVDPWTPPTDIPPGVAPYGV